MIAEANCRLRDNGLDVRFELADARHNDPVRAIAEIARVTRPGGRIAALEYVLGTAFIDHPDLELSDTIRDTFIAADRSAPARPTAGGPQFTKQTPKPTYRRRQRVHRRRHRAMTTPSTRAPVRSKP